MMRTSLLSLFLLLSISGAGVAQTTAEEFRARGLVWMKQGNLAQIVCSVRTCREPASTAFYQALSQQLERPDPVNEEWLNTVARAFRLEGMGGPTRALREAGYLWPITRWRGTMFEGDGPDHQWDSHGTWD